MTNPSAFVNLLRQFDRATIESIDTHIPRTFHPMGILAVARTLRRRYLHSHWGSSTPKRCLERNWAIDLPRPRRLGCAT
ncbi:MAG TPA: hypothetical protein IGS17_09420 [Oscillatoriales cyanobacterium M59_W2019_021]|nr:hypothetical protein [Oscillatoriales cyanobacterium M4454_W2019_049]HIK51127.1 hypothetical protein [Oscillatoriales cyanobacterium M59_W2019_021]